MGFNKLYGECLKMKKRGVPHEEIKAYQKLRSSLIREALTKWAFRFRRKSDITVIEGAVQERHDDEE